MQILCVCYLIIASISSIYTNIVLDKCSISQSRLARSILNELVFPLFQYANVVVNEQCPFNPKHDIYSIHEQMKNKISDYDWECQLCDIKQMPIVLIVLFVYHLIVLYFDVPY
uniref:Zinc finger, C2H2-type domain-containing protein n=1 Tax=Schistosoma japonicum TaxID=6182 RepID=C1LG89_SCHJA|nr:Zinc finger, C2H2-type domain-containing protein [Schistosoma japonicum]